MRIIICSSELQVIMTSGVLHGINRIRKCTRQSGIPAKINAAIKRYQRKESPSKDVLLPDVTSISLTISI